MKNNISVTPVNKYAQPKYPTQENAKLAPELLRKLPSRWQKNAAVVAAAGLFGAITLTSCGILEPKLDGANSGYSPESENFLNVAPVFIHGEGTGSMGCVMIAPPVFLSEQEALAIIKNIAEIEGLNFKAEPPGYIATENKIETDHKYSWDNNIYILGGGSVGLDLYDAENQVAVTFISMDKAKMHYVDAKGNVTMESSVSSYRPRELAELTAEDFAQQRGDINIGVFYDPGKDWEHEEVVRIREEYNEKLREFWKIEYDEADQEKINDMYMEILREYEENVKVLIAENLRSQVRDFIEWLQAQGII